MNAFLGPKVKTFVLGLSKRLEGAGLKGDVHIMTSNGGVATARTIAEKPVYSLLSGLAGGVLGGEWVGRRTRRENLITFDVGGTSADIGIVTAQGITEASARDTKIAGFPVMVPMIDVHTIGAGARHVAYVDEGGAFRSARAVRARFRDRLATARAEKSPQSQMQTWCWGVSTRNIFWVAKCRSIPRRQWMRLPC